MVSSHHTTYLTHTHTLASLLCRCISRLSFFCFSSHTIHDVLYVFYMVTQQSRDVLDFGERDAPPPKKPGTGGKIRANMSSGSGDKAEAGNDGDGKKEKGDGADGSADDDSDDEDVDVNENGSKVFFDEPGSGVGFVTVQVR